MKLLILPLLSTIFFASESKQANTTETESTLSVSESKKKNTTINFQDGAGAGRMSSIAFKNQDYCRAELENFEFDVKFTVVSASVYFSGANFKNVEKGFITSNSLKSIKHLMVRCMPGSIVSFDDIKVKGPDDRISTIQGVNFSLY
jgi:hypothetical protein